jgi:hypothetical protein
VEDHDRRCCRRRLLTWRISPVFPSSQHHAVPCEKAPVQISHGGSQGFKSPHLHPQTRRSERRQPRAGGAHCTLRPRRGRKLTSQCKRGRLSKTRRLGPGPHTMTTQRGRRQLPTDGRSSRIQSTMRSKRPLLNHRPRRRPRPSRPTAGPARPAPASSATVQPRADDAPSWTRRATTPTRPSEPHDCLPHCHAPRPFRSATAAAGRHGHRTPTPDAGGRRPEAGGRTPGRSDTRTGHRTPISWTATRGTLDARTGHRRGQGDDSTAGVRTS